MAKKTKKKYKFLLDHAEKAAGKEIREQESIQALIEYIHVSNSVDEQPSEIFGVWRDTVRIGFNRPSDDWWSTFKFGFSRGVGLTVLKTKENLRFARYVVNRSDEDAMRIDWRTVGNNFRKAFGTVYDDYVRMLDNEQEQSEKAERSKSKKKDVASKTG